ncbi:reverse transcriptase domain-containing protein [Tanacetum coccineum]
MLAQVSSRGNVGNQNGNVVNENVQENMGNMLVNGNRIGCSYKEFLACNPKEYDGKGGVVVLTHWIEKIENVHDMSGCSNDQKKYTAGSFVGKALTWWNSQIRTLSQEVAVSMSWNEFKFMMIQEFCPSHEMQKLESELWNHAMVGVGYAVYIDRFHELERLVPHLVAPESRMIERYVYGLAPQIREMVAATQPKTMQKAMQICYVLNLGSISNKLICLESCCVIVVLFQSCSSDLDLDHSIILLPLRSYHIIILYRESILILSFEASNQHTYTFLTTYNLPHVELLS